MYSLVVKIGVDMVLLYDTHPKIHKAHNHLDTTCLPFTSEGRDVKYFGMTGLIFRWSFYSFLSISMTIACDS